MPADRLGMPEPPRSTPGRFTAGRFLQALAIGKGEAGNALAFADEQRQWLDRAQIVGALKSAVSPIDTGDYPGALAVADSFLAAMRDASIPLRLQGLRRVPMLTRIFVDTSGVLAAQVAEGQPIPVLQGNWTSTTLTLRKFCGVVVQTDELLRLLSPVATAAIVDDLAQATAEAENDAFLNADVPGSVLYGQSGLNAAGSALANVDSDLKLLIAAVRGASDPNATFIMSKGTASYLGTLRGTGGAAAFPDIGPSGGRLLGLQVLISTAAEDADSPSLHISSSR